MWFNESGDPKDAEIRAVSVLNLLWVFLNIVSVSRM